MRYVLLWDNRSIIFKTIRGFMQANCDVSSISGDSGPRDGRRHVWLRPSRLPGKVRWAMPDQVGRQGGTPYIGLMAHHVRNRQRSLHGLRIDSSFGSTRYLTSSPPCDAVTVKCPPIYRARYFVDVHAPGLFYALISKPAAMIGYPATGATTTIPTDSPSGFRNSCRTTVRPSA